MSEQNELTTEDILAADDSELKPVTIPEWKKNGADGLAYLKVMSAKDAMRFGELMADPARRPDAMLRLVGFCLVNAKGERLMPDAMLEKFREKSVKVYMRLQKIALELNGFTDDEKATESAKKD